MGMDVIEVVLLVESALVPPRELGELGIDFKTPAELTDAAYALVRADGPEDNGSLTLRAFSRIRAAMREAGVTAPIELETRLADILPEPRKRDQLSAILTRAGFEPMRQQPFGLQWLWGVTVIDLVTTAVVQYCQQLRAPDLGWSREQVREIVRSAIYVTVKNREFKDADNLYQQVGLF